MPNGKGDIMAQAVYLAQLEAARGNCKCKTCRILRKATKMMTEQFLTTTEASEKDVEEAAKTVKGSGQEGFALGEEDE